MTAVDGSRKPGRPDKLSPKLTRQLCQGIRDTGASLAEVARSVGVSERTLHRWQASGADAERASPRFRQFWQAITRARAQRTLRDLKAISAAISLDWRAAAWRLERSNPKAWGMRLELLHDQDVNELLGKLERGMHPKSYLRALALVTDDLAALAETQRQQAHPPEDEEDDEGKAQ